MGEVESRREQRSRAPTVGALGDAGAVAEEQISVHVGNAGAIVEGIRMRGI